MLASNFEAIGHVTLVLRAKNRPKSLAQKSGLIQPRLKGGESSSQFRWFTIAKIEL